MGELYKYLISHIWFFSPTQQVYKQKMKHLLCEHQNTISELKADGSVSTQLAHKEQEQIEAELHENMRAIKIDMQGLDNENLVKELELVCTTHCFISI